MLTGNPINLMVKTMGFCRFSPTNQSIESIDVDPNPDPQPVAEMAELRLLRLPQRLPGEVQRPRLDLLVVKSQMSYTNCLDHHIYIHMYMYE